MLKSKKQPRITGSLRKSIAKELEVKYKQGATIRALADAEGKSYGFVHHLLTQHGVKMRPRGGARTKLGQAQ
jgi:hypothetical protein